LRLRLLLGERLARHGWLGLRLRLLLGERLTRHGRLRLRLHLLLGERAAGHRRLGLRLRLLLWEWLSRRRRRRLRLGLLLGERLRRRRGRWRLWLGLLLRLRGGHLRRRLWGRLLLRRRLGAGMLRVLTALGRRVLGNHDGSRCGRSPDAFGSQEPLRHGERGYRRDRQQDALSRGFGLQILGQSPRQDPLPGVAAPFDRARAMNLVATRLATYCGRTLIFGTTIQQMQWCQYLGGQAAGPREQRSIPSEPGSTARHNAVAPGSFRVWRRRGGCGRQAAGDMCG
jgi:hypothetical protein